MTAPTLITLATTAPPLWFPFDAPVTARLGWTLLHFLWQGAAVAAALTIGLALLRTRAPRWRYAAACGAMVAMVACPVVTFVVLRPDVADATPDAGIREVPASAARPAAPPLEVVRADGAAAEPGRATHSRVQHPLIVLAWFAGVLALSAWRVCGWAVLRSRVRTHSAPVPTGVADAVSRLRQALGVGRPVAPP